MKSGLAICVILVFCSCPGGMAQTRLTTGPYTVNSKIDVQLKKLLLLDSATLKQSMSIKVTRNNATFFDQTLDCFTKSTLKNDSIHIIGHMLGELGYGFQLILFNDSCIVAPFALSDQDILKYNKADTVAFGFLPLMSKNYKVVLAKAPAYKEGESVEGYVELESVPFYYTEITGGFLIQIRAYFKTARVKREE